MGNLNSSLVQQATCVGTYPFINVSIHFAILRTRLITDITSVQSSFPRTLCSIYNFKYPKWSFSLELAILHETSDSDRALLLFDVIWLPTAFLFFLKGNVILVVWGACDPHSALGSFWAVRSHRMGNVIILKRGIQCLQPPWDLNCFPGGSNVDTTWASHYQRWKTFLYGNHVVSVSCSNKADSPELPLKA